MYSYEANLRSYINACNLIVPRVTRILCIVGKEGGDQFDHHLYSSEDGLHAEHSMLTSIEQGEFEVNGSMILYSNHSPCAQCSDRLCRFMSKNQSVTMTIIFVQLYRVDELYNNKGMVQQN